MLNINLPVSILREGKRFIAYTPALDLSTSGKSHEEAKERFKEVVSIFIEEVIKKGTLEEVLGDLGWKNIRTKWVPPTLVSQESESFRIPVLK